MHYTIDGSVPNEGSPTVSGAVSVPSGRTLKVVAYRSSVFSTYAAAQVLSEYEVTEGATTVEDINYHYHVAVQRTALTSKLGNSGVDVMVGTNTTPSKTSAMVSGSTHQISLWDTSTVVGAYNGLPGMVWDSQPTWFWSRLLYSAAVVTFAWRYDPGRFAANTTVSLLTLTISSRTHIITYKYIVDTATRQSNIIRTLTIKDGLTTSETTTSGAVIAIGSDNTLTISITNGMVSLTDTVGISIESSPEFTAGMLWSIEGTVNPNGVAPADLLLNNIIQCAATVTATSGKLRLAPGTLMCTKTQELVQKTDYLDFRMPRTLNNVRHSLLTNTYTTPILNPPAVIGFDDQSKTTRVDGLFSVAMPGYIDTGYDFDVSVRLATDFLALMTYPETEVNSPNLPTVSLFLADPSSPLNDLTDIATGLSLRMFVPAGRPGAYPVFLELYSSGSAPTRLTLSSNSRQIELSLSGRAGGIALSAIIDGMPTFLATMAPVSGPREVRVRRTGNTKLGRKQLTDFISYTATARYIQEQCASPVIVGADFMYRGAATGFAPTAITIPSNTNYAVWFNQETETVSAEPITFEPSDGRILVGIIETRDGNIIWTNTMYASLVKVRTQVDSILGGTVIGVGSNISVADHRINWTENGYERSSPVGDLSWNTPDSHLDMRQGRQTVHAYEQQKIRMTASRIQLQ
jgi:hypothetical protein